MKKIVVYKTISGKEPFTDWFYKIRDEEVKSKIVTRLDRLRYNNYGHYRYLGSDLIELKENIGGGIRIYFTEKEEEIIILLCGGNKDSQKRDIIKVQKYLEELKNEKKYK